jgi:uncharacterized protein (DUF58 family)
VVHRERNAAVLAPELLARVQQIHVRTHRLVSTALAGGYRSTFRGSGLEFEEVRPYQPGDDVRSIDWNVTARAGEAYVKSFREERELTLNLIIDSGPTMDFGSQGWSKREAAAQLACLLSFVAMRHSDRVGLTLFSEEPGAHLPPEKGRGHALRLVREVLSAPLGGAGSDMYSMLRQANLAIRGRSVLFLVSDFLCLLDGDREACVDELSRLSRVHDVIAVRVLDPLEEELPAAGLVRLAPIAGGEVRELDASSEPVRTRWRDEAVQRREEIEELLGRARVDLLSIPTVGDLGAPVQEFFRRRQNRSRGRTC